MGSQTSKVQQVDEEFSNHSSINFETEEAPIDIKASLKRGNEMSADEQNLIGERINYFLLSIVSIFHFNIFCHHKGITFSLPQRVCA